QAEDGIRDRNVTGVQTCALPIYFFMQDQRIWNIIHRYLSGEYTPDEEQRLYTWLAEDPAHQEFFNAIKKVWQVRPAYDVEADFRSEERRVGKECSYWLSRHEEKE